MSAPPCSKSPAHSFRSSTFASLIVSVATPQRVSVSAVPASTLATGRSRASGTRPSGGSGTAGASRPTARWSATVTCSPFDLGREHAAPLERAVRHGLRPHRSEAARASELLRRAPRLCRAPSRSGCAALRAACRRARGFPLAAGDRRCTTSTRCFSPARPGRAASPCRASSPWPGTDLGVRADPRRRDGNGHDHVPLMRDLEAEPAIARRGTSSRSATTTPDSLVESLQAGGFEVGVHGLYHDGRDLESRDPRGAAAGDPQLRRALGRRRLPLTGDPPRLGPDAGCCRSTTTPRRRTPTRSSRRAAAAARGSVRQRRARRASDHATAGPHAVRDPAARRGAPGSRRPIGCAAGVAWRCCITHPDYMIEPDRLDVYYALPRAATRTTSPRGVRCRAR